MKKLWIPILLVLLGACGFGSFFQRKDDESARKIASMAHESLMSDVATFGSTIDDKLLSLHSYYLIGQKNLRALDLEIGQEKSSLLESDHYLNLLAVKTQVEEIEDELKTIFTAVTTTKKKSDQKRAWIMRVKIQEFADKSQVRYLSMQNLSYKLGFKMNDTTHSSLVAMKDLHTEYDTLEALNPKEFQVYEKNIEHLSHLMDLKIQGRDKKFFPSETRSGNITGDEFPAKVWALTFDDGPSPKTSPRILQNLLDKNLKATFFQLTEQVLANKETARSIKEAGMNIASHSWSHKQLTKEGASVQDKEITQAASKLKEFHKIEQLQFFRLPYGAGVSNTQIRQKIAENNLIHVFWNIDTLDWMPQSPEQIVERTKAQMKNTKKDAGIILFHDIHERTVSASAVIMDYLKQEDRRVCSLNEIVDQINEGVETICAK